MKHALVVNLAGVPGAGKSTAAAYIFSQLKMRGVNAELIDEFAKGKVWERNQKVFENQAYLFGKQSFKLSRCADEVDVIITDSPLFLSILYNNDFRLTENFNKCVMDVYNSYENVTYLVNRVKPYNPKGRHQTESESDALGEPIKNLLKDRKINYKEINGDLIGYNLVVGEVIKLLRERGVKVNEM